MRTYNEDAQLFGSSGQQFGGSSGAFTSGLGSLNRIQGDVRAADNAFDTGLSDLPRSSPRGSGPWARAFGSEGGRYTATGSSYFNRDFKGSPRPPLGANTSGGNRFFNNSSSLSTSRPSGDPFVRQQAPLRQGNRFNQGPLGYGAPVSPMAGPAGPGMDHFNVYDMKSLAAALATVQAGTGAVAQVFRSCTFRPRLPGLTKLLSQLTREGNWQKGLELFESLGVLGVAPDTTITNAAISSCDKGGQWEKALQVFNGMEAAGLQRDAITYSAVISALSKGRQWSLAIDVFNHMSDAGIECDAVTCCSLITALDKGGQWQLAEQVFMQMYTDHPQFSMLLKCMDSIPILDANEQASQGGAQQTGSGHSMGQQDVLPSPSTTTASPAWSPDQVFGLSGPAPPKKPPGSPRSGGASNQSDNWLGKALPGTILAGMPPLPPHLQDSGALSAYITSKMYRSVSAIPRIDEHAPLAMGEATSGDDTKLSTDQAAAAGGVVPPASPPTPIKAPGPLRQAWLQQELSDQSVLSADVDQPAGKLGPEKQAAAAAAEDGQGHTLDKEAKPANISHITQQLATMGLLPPGADAGYVAQTLKQEEPTITPMLAGNIGGSGGQMTPSMVDHLLSLAQSTGQQLPPQLLATLLEQQGGSGMPLSGVGMSQAMLAGLPPGSHLERTLSCPANQRSGLLRTSSLNCKKSAPNRVCCNALLAAYARAVPTQWKRALRLLDLMWQCSGELQPDIVSYNTVIKACGNAHQVGIGFQVYQLMRSRHIEPTVATYGTLICIAADVGASALVKQAWSWLQASRLEVHVTAANAYLSALIKEGDWDDAQALFNAMLSPMGPCRPNAVTFSVMSTAYLARGEPGAVRRLYRQMVSVGVHPSASTLGQLVCVLAVRGLWEDALTILAALCRHEGDGGGRPSLGVFLSLFSAIRDAARALPPNDAASKRMYLHVANEARKLLRSQSIAHPDIAVYRAMIGAFAAVGEAEVCLELFNSMVLSGMPVDEEVAAGLLAALAEAASWEKLVQLITALGQDNGVECLPAHAIVGVLQAMAAGGMWLHAYQVAKAIRGAGSNGGLREHWKQAMENIKSTNNPNLLLLVLLADREAVGAWNDALCLMNWQQSLEQGTGGFAKSAECYIIMTELLYVHGGVEGLKQAVMLMKDAHEKGILKYYTLPRIERATNTATDNTVNATTDIGSNAAGNKEKKGDTAAGNSIDTDAGNFGLAFGMRNSCGAWDSITGIAHSPAGVLESGMDMGTPSRRPAAEPGSFVVVQGPSTVHAMVVLLAWISALADMAKRHGHKLSTSMADILLAMSPTLAERQQAEQQVQSDMAALGFSDGTVADSPGGKGLLVVEPATASGGLQGRAGLSQLRRVVSLVLSGAYLSLLSPDPMTPVNMTPEQQEVLVLKPPGAQYFLDTENPALLHVSTTSLYQRVLGATA